jgi:hypothetical protein
LVSFPWMGCVCCCLCVESFKIVCVIFYLHSWYWTYGEIARVDLLF